MSRSRCRETTEAPARMRQAASQAVPAQETDQGIETRRRLRAGREVQVSSVPVQFNCRR